MPIRPCPACDAQTSRLLEEVSRHAVVWYDRCDACGHVWTVHRDTGSVHHVTPLDGDETAGPAAEVSPQHWSQKTASWLDAQLRSGFNLVSSAADANDR